MSTRSTSGSSARDSHFRVDFAQPNRSANAAEFLAVAGADDRETRLDGKIEELPVPGTTRSNARDP
jgi:hypothetical protein